MYYAMFRLCLIPIRVLILEYIGSDGLIFLLLLIRVFRPVSTYLD
jgi:hypothetical protein